MYYLNLEKERKSPHIQPPNDSNNHGFDNERNEYVCSAKDHIAYRYEIKRQIGKGSFGQVFQCYDHKTGETVALKVLRNQKKLHKQGLIEASILMSLKQSDPDDKRNIVRVYD